MVSGLQDSWRCSEMFRLRNIGNILNWKPSIQTASLQSLPDTPKGFPNEAKFVLRIWRIVPPKESSGQQQSWESLDGPTPIIECQAGRQLVPCLQSLGWLGQGSNSQPTSLREDAIPLNHWADYITTTGLSWWQCNTIFKGLNPFIHPPITCKILRLSALTSSQRD